MILSNVKKREKRAYNKKNVSDKFKTRYGILSKPSIKIENNPLQENPSFKTLIAWLKRNPEPISVIEKIVNETPLQKTNIIELFQYLDFTGFGKLMYGRRGNKTRFIWSVDFNNINFKNVLPSTYQYEKGINSETDKSTTHEKISISKAKELLGLTFEVDPKCIKIIIEV